ncbi:complement C1q and tumor necrosis factor-related protein 9-like isoform X3 [Epinephelus moara]|uniref:complement C1q and tumor necrosis factor-related protein 9-like isoform X3 n=1 Tax=Epinephelus moara TaxID=300413 RepID=UPI00214F5707|nr:complement C1q and tumor necrosis factor-related protein 9-like isoform X3 [Epinephelus moara]
MAYDNPAANDRPVAFTAKLNIDNSYPQQPGILKFATVLLNEGGGYSPNTGIFTCPMDGLYHFMVHMTVYGRGQCALLKNGEKVVSLYHVNEPDLLSYNSSQVSSMSSLVRLSKRDEVWINLWGEGRMDIFATEDNDTIFTGFYLR